MHPGDRCLYPERVRGMGVKGDAQGVLHFSALPSPSVEGHPPQAPREALPVSRVTSGWSLDLAPRKTIWGPQGLQWCWRTLGDLSLCPRDAQKEPLAGEMGSICGIRAPRTLALTSCGASVPSLVLLNTVERSGNPMGLWPLFMPVPTLPPLGFLISLLLSWLQAGL